MARIDFDQPVQIYFGKPGRSRTVSTVREAIYCLKSEEWLGRSTPMSRMAAAALNGARTGHLTPAEARRAFAEAALEAHILVPGEKRQ